MAEVADRVTLRIDGEEITVDAETTILAAARDLGIEIPHLCSRREGDESTHCRLCLVVVDDGHETRMVTACDAPVMEGSSVRTAGDDLDRLREWSLKLLLCAQPMAEDVRELASHRGVKLDGLRNTRGHEGCILCGFCVRAVRDVDGLHSGGITGKNSDHRIYPPSDEWSRCVPVDRLRTDWGTRRDCRYALMGLTPGAVCSRDYDCARCPVDHEMFDRFSGRHPIFAKSSKGVGR